MNFQKLRRIEHLSPLLVSLIRKIQACTWLQECLSSQDAASTSGSSVVDALANRASRTLYVGGLERRTTDDSLRSRFSCFGHILETGYFCIFPV